MVRFMSETSQERRKVLPTVFSTKKFFIFWKLILSYNKYIFSDFS